MMEMESKIALKKKIAQLEEGSKQLELQAIHDQYIAEMQNAYHVFVTGMRTQTDDPKKAFREYVEDNRAMRAAALAALEELG